MKIEKGERSWEEGWDEEREGGEELRRGEGWEGMKKEKGGGGEGKRGGIKKEKGGQANVFKMPHVTQDRYRVL